MKLIVRRVERPREGALRALSDSLRDRLGSGVVVLASSNDGKVTLVVSVTKDLTSRVQAGRLVKELAPIVGGGGGGRPDFAEAGGKDPAGIDDAGPEGPGRTSNLNYRTEIGACSFRTLCPAFPRKSLITRGHRLCGRARLRCLQSVSLTAEPSLASSPALTLLLCPVTASAQIYAWRDASGNLVLSDKAKDPSAKSYSLSPTSTRPSRTTRPLASARRSIRRPDRGACGVEHASTSTWCAR